MCQYMSCDGNRPEVPHLRDHNRGSGSRPACALSVVDEIHVRLRNGHHLQLALGEVMIAVNRAWLTQGHGA